MALLFYKVRVLSYSHQPVFLDAGLRYRLDKKLVIRGYLKETVTDEQAAINLITKEQNILAAATDYDDIYLEGISFGSGRITNINFEGGTLAREEEYTYEIECYEEGNLFNATAGVYDGLTWLNARHIESIDEDFEYSDDSDGTKTYSHNLSIKYREFADRDAGLAAAKAIATNFINSNTGFGSYLNSYAGLSGKRRIYTENYDIINVTASIQEVVTVPKDAAGNYSYGLIYSIEQDEAGFVNIAETVDIQGLTRPPMYGAEEGFSALEGGAYTRCNSIYTAYNFSDSALFSTAITKQESKNPFAGTIQLKTTFTNNPKYQNSAIWERTLELVLNQDNTYSVSENGTIKGFGRPLAGKYQAALDFYEDNVSDGDIDTRLQALYDTTGRAQTLFTTSQSFRKNEYLGEISYSKSKSDNDQGGAGSIRKAETEVILAHGVHMVEGFEIFNYKEILQSQHQIELSNKSMSIKLNGIRGTSLDTYLTYAKGLAALEIPTEDNYLAQVQYSISPIQNTFSFNCQWIFVGAYRQINDLILT